MIDHDPEFQKPGLFTRILIWIAGADEDTLRKCPPHDWDCLRAVALLFIAVWIYQSAILSIVAHQILSGDGQVHPELIFGPMFVATLVLLVDSFVFLRAGYHADGIAALGRAGLDIGGGAAAKVKAGLFLTLRIILSVIFAALCGIFVGLILFHKDIAADIDRQFQQDNAALIAKATTDVDAEIQRATAEVKDANANLAALQQQVAAARDGSIDPAAGDAGVRAEQDEVSQLLAEQAQRDSEEVASQKFASDELGGVKGDAQNSGVPGEGPVRRAAEERVRIAVANAEQAKRAVDAARGRLDALRAKIASSAGDRAGRAQAELPGLQADLQDATTDVATQRDNLAKLVKDRDDAIRTEVENSPDCVGRDQGILAQLSALKRIAHDPEIATVIVLLDLTSFGLELAAVLAKVTSFIPTTYSALLARDAYMRVVEIVDGMDAVLNRRPHGVEPETEADTLPPISVPSDQDQVPENEVPPLPNEPSPDGSAENSPEFTIGVAEKRPRGRPRKETGGGLPAPAGKRGNGHDQSDESEQ